MNTTDLHIGDCLTILPTLPAGSADLALLDPPYNVGLSYAAYDDNRPADEYLAWLDAVFAALARVLSPSGSL